MQAALLESDETLAWLEGRGIDWGTIADAWLGYIPTDAASRYRDCVTIPYFDARGELVGVRYRHLRAGAPSKYESPKGFGTHLYNVAGTNAPVVAVCEGEFDALIMKQLGIEAVAIAGAHTWRREWRWLFRNCDLVYVITDADEEGIKARNKILGHVGDVTEVEAVELPNGLDVTDLYLKDPDELRRHLQ